MTKNEEAVIKAFIYRTQSSINRFRDLSDAFNKTGQSEVAAVIDKEISTLRFNLNSLLVKDLDISLE